MGDAIRLRASLRDKVWGKTHLAPWFPDSAQKTGEAWFLADHELPLLVKLLFTSERLSVQVHPKDGEDGPRGKTEMWYVLQADPGASIALGFREPLSRERLTEATRTGEVEQLLNWFPVQPGDTFFAPAHTVHAIGAGIVLCEIQQNSDVTYRMWDYGRPRELHLAKALAIADLTVHPGRAVPQAIAPGRDELVRCQYFVTELVRLEAGQEMIPAPENCQLWIALGGDAAIGDSAVRQGECWMMPEGGTQPVVHATTDSTFLRTYTPA